MFIKKDVKFFQPSALLRELILLFEIEMESHTTQHKLADRAGIVPAMVNKYLKEFVRKGFLKVYGKTNRDRSYYLTAEGNERLMDLLRMYFNETIGLYTYARNEIKKRLLAFYEEGIRRVVFYGAAETGEIALSVGKEIGFEIAGIVDSSANKQGKKIGGEQVLGPDTIESLLPEAVIITSFGYQNQLSERLKYLQLKGIKIRKI